MSDTAAGAPSERTPDFIPGWFKRVHPGTQRPAAPTLDEAVRLLDDVAGVFPIAFLRSGEFVRPARPPQKGFVIGRMARDMELAVPPGYWLVRGDDGEICIWRDDDFRAKFSRRDDIEWRPAALRQDESGTELFGDGWRGTLPAEGTRRKLVRDVLEDRGVHPTRALDHADAIEAALLDSTIAAEDQLTAKREELIEIHRFLDELGAPCGPEISSPTALRRLRAWKGIVLGDVAPDAEIFAADGANIGGLHVVLGAQDGVPYVSLVELEHLFANLYEDISERQAKKQRKEAELTGTMEARDGESKLRDNPHLTAEERASIEKRLETARIDEEHRVDNEDDRPLWRVEADYALNHLRNAAAAWLGT